MLVSAFRTLRRTFQRRSYRPGRTLSRFLVPDIRRDVEVIDADRIDEGRITVRARTWNVLYAARGLVPEPPFGEPREVAVDELWRWDGALWGGPVPTASDGAANEGKGDPHA